jgi:phosphopantetheinyl transferase (holo-ACP synthase)
MRKISPILCAMALGLFLPACFAAKKVNTFADAQRCRIAGTVDIGCFHDSLPRFEQFVLQDDAAWIQKFIVGEALVKVYDSAHISSPFEAAVRDKVKVYEKAKELLSKGELGEIDDCKDEGNPDACLRGRYCFKEAFIKIKNYLVTNDADKCQAEIRWFDKEIQGNC